MPTLANFSVIHQVVPTLRLRDLRHARDRRRQDSSLSGSSAIRDLLFCIFSPLDRRPLGPVGSAEGPLPSGLLAQLAFPVRALRRPAA